MRYWIYSINVGASAIRDTSDHYLAVRSRSMGNEAGSPLPAQPSGTVIEDLENALHFWFQGKAVDWVLIRPDRFIAAVGCRADAVAELGAFCDTVLPPVRAAGPERAAIQPRNQIEAQTEAQAA